MELAPILLCWPLVLGQAPAAQTKRFEIQAQACPDESALTAALPPSDSAGPPLKLVVAVEGERLRVSLSDAGGGALLATRAIDAAGMGCDERAHAISLLVEAWLADLPFRAASQAAALPPPDAAPTAPISSPPAAPPPSAVPPRARLLSLDARVAAAAPIGLFPGSAGFGGELALALGVGHYLTFGVDGALFTNLSASDPNGTGTASLQRQQLGGFGGITLGRGGTQELTLAAGAEDDRFQVATAGYPHTGGDQEDDVALTGRALYARAFGSRLYLFGAVEMAFLLNRQAFQVKDPGGNVTLLSVPQALLELTLGVGLHLF